MADTQKTGFRRITSKGQVTIPETIRKRYNITMQTKLEFVPSSAGIAKARKRTREFQEVGGISIEELDCS